MTDADVRPLHSDVLTRALLEASPDAVVVVDAQGTIVSLNAMASELLGYETGELVGSSVDDLVPPSARRAHTAARNNYGGRRRAMSSRPDLLATRKDGSSFTVQVSLTPIGASGDRIAAVLRDVTELRRVTHESERWANVFEHIELGVFVSRPDGTIDLCNPAFARMHGWGDDDLIGLSELATFAPEVRADVARHLAVVEERGHHTWETVHVRADGRRIPVFVDATAIHDDDGVYRYRAVTVKDISERLAAAERLAHLAAHDQLTGLANRTRLLEDAERALADAGDRTVAVLFCDLDEFKMVNDSMGHAAGDALLVVLAERFRDALPANAVASRPGGDEFVFLVRDLDPAADLAEHQARQVAAGLLEAIADPIEIQGRRLHATMSIGIALSQGADATPADLLRDSDAAMYRAKAAGRSSIDVFDNDLRARTLRRVHLESELRDAREHDQFVVHYQPILDLRTETVIGAEALLRWRHPDRGLQLPEEFLDVAESAGLIVDIGRAVLGEAAHSVARWRHATGKDLYVTVNVAAPQLGAGQLLGAVRSLLDDLDLPDDAIRLEITENTLLAQDGAAAEELDALVRAGTHIGLDDFGTGYGSLTHLMSSGASFLKLDRRFVTAIGSPIAEAVIGLGLGLHLDVIAEGIETRSQARSLIALGARHGQGFLYGRPAPEDVFAARFLQPGRRGIQAKVAPAGG
jgi:diguanylate cyclase (GGDEF)-like protein/PAS domain S-box-containing protein